MLVIIGGTFDKLHAGHKRLLDVAAHIAGSDRLVVGLMSDASISKKPHMVNQFNRRAKDIEEYLLMYKQLNFSVVEIDGIVPTHTEDIIGWEDIECIIVSEETYEGAIYFNSVRRELKMNPLIIVVVPLMKAYDGERISSTRVRAGEIDLDGGAL